MTERDKRDANSRETEMRIAEARLRWSSFEWAVSGLLAICAVLLGFCVALMWSYLPAITTTATSSTATKNETEKKPAYLGSKNNRPSRIQNWTRSKMSCAPLIRRRLARLT
jgi:hypothetical protein